MKTTIHKTPRQVFALAGQIVTTAAHAERIGRMAAATDKMWLIPQCESVARKLKQAQAKATWSAQ